MKPSLTTEEEEEGCPPLSPTVLVVLVLAINGYSRIWPPMTNPLEAISNWPQGGITILLVLLLEVMVVVVVVVMMMVVVVVVGCLMRLVAIIIIMPSIIVIAHHHMS